MEHVPKLQRSYISIATSWRKIKAPEDRHIASLIDKKKKFPVKSIGYEVNFSPIVAILSSRSTYE